MDYQITGRLVNEIGDGLKNLLVVFYDTDRKLKIPKNLKKTVTEYLEDKGSERLGSTYSREDGSFDFDYKYEDFAPQKEEKRPDIFVVVLSPEEKGKELADRILYFSDYPVHNGGKSEALLINVSSLDKSVITSVYGSGETKISTILKSIEGDEKEERLLKKHLAPKIAKKLEKHKKRNEKANTLFANLSALPKKIRENPLFLSQSNSLADATIYSIEKGVEQLEFNVPAAMDIQISDEEKKKLGIDDNTNPINEISIPYGKYCGLLSKKTKGKTLVRKQSLKDIIDAVLKKEDRETDTSNPEDSEERTESSTPTTSIVEGEEIKFTRDKISEVYGPIQNTLDNSVLYASVKTRVNFDQDTSPINQKAFHDFHNLQIAFKDVWREILDRTLEEQFKEWYNEIVDIVEEYHIDWEPMTEAEIILQEDLERALLQESMDFREVISILNEKSSIVGEGLPIPEKLSEYDIPNIGSWDKLSISQQSSIIKIIEKQHLDQYSEKSESEKIDNLIELFLGNYFEILKNIKWSNEPSEYFGKSLEEVYNIERVKKINNSGELTPPKGGWGWEYFKNRIILSRENFNTQEFSFFHDSLNVHWDNSKTSSQSIDINFSKFIRNLLKTEKTAQIVNILKDPRGIKSRVARLLKEINQRLLEPYAFHVFAKDSVNYGIMTTYRQEWTPSNWQVGDLVSTMPLTPGEKRKFTKKLKVKKTRSQKEVESSLSRHTDEASYVTKAHSEIFKKVNTATNFNLTIEGNLAFQAGVAQGGVKTTTGYKNDQSTESSAKKKSIRESTKKAASEFKNERSVEIISKEESDYEESTSGEISNPNNEITVTYLFYELERQYIVSENLHKLTPVILVAFDVPAPQEVDEDWLLTHEWILRRILLDDSFHEALDYLREGLIGDEINYEAAKGHYHQQKEIVDDMAANVYNLMTLKSRLQSKFNTATNSKNIVGFKERKRDNAKTESIFGAIFNPVQLFSTLPDYNEAKNELTGQYDSEFFEAERKALESRVNQVREELASAEEELASETNALEKAKNQMMAFTAKIYTKRNLINQLRIHVKQNILYYMQGIWEHEPPDQRFFRLYNVEASMPIPGEDVKVEMVNGGFRTGSSIADRLGIPGTRSTGTYVNFPKPDRIDKRPLHEIADIDNLLGFKGNYAIFPLKTCTYITDFMMKDYVNEYLNLKDPDFDGEISTEDLEEIHTRIKEDPEHKELAERIAEILTARFANPVIKDDVIVVPTGQLFIEALPGKHALLEDFKLKHRAMDVLKVQEEVREAQIENLRKSARVLNKDYEDADIDKNINISGTNSNLNIETD